MIEATKCHNTTIRKSTLGRNQRELRRGEVVMRIGRCITATPGWLLGYTVTKAFRIGTIKYRPAPLWSYIHARSFNSQTTKCSERLFCCPWCAQLLMGAFYFTLRLCMLTYSSKSHLPSYISPLFNTATGLYGKERYYGHLSRKFSNSICIDLSYLNDWYGYLSGWTYLTLWCGKYSIGISQRLPCEHMLPGFSVLYKSPSLRGFEQKRGLLPLKNLIYSLIRNWQLLMLVLAMTVSKGKTSFHSYWVWPLR